MSKETYTSVKRDLHYTIAFYSVRTEYTVWAVKLGRVCTYVHTYIHIGGKTEKPGTLVIDSIQVEGEEATKRLGGRDTRPAQVWKLISERLQIDGDQDLKRARGHDLRLQHGYNLAR